MRVKNSYLYWGVFLLALGGAIAAVTYLQPDPTAVVDVLRYWPLVVIAFGVGLVLRRTQFNVAGGILAAAVPGLLLGSAIAVGPQVGWDCAPHDRELTSLHADQGTFSAPARVDVTHRLRDPHDHDPSGLRLGPPGGQHRGLRTRRRRLDDRPVAAKRPRRPLVRRLRAGRVGADPADVPHRRPQRGGQRRRRPHEPERLPTSGRWRSRRTPGDRPLTLPRHGWSRSPPR